MSIKLEDISLREIFQNGWWRLRIVNEAQNVKCSTTSQRSDLWNEIRTEEKDIKGGSRQQDQDKSCSQVKQTLQRGILTKASPWISTTQSDYYGEKCPKEIEETKGKYSTIKRGKRENVNKLISHVTHVPMVRMVCHNDNHFVSTYNRDFRIPGTLKPDFKCKEPYDFSCQSKKPPQMYGAMPWASSYESDYGQFVKVKASEKPASRDTGPISISDELIFTPQWTTTYQDYGHLKNKQFVSISSGCSAEEELELKRLRIPVTSQVGQLLRY